ENAPRRAAIVREGAGPVSVRGFCSLANLTPSAGGGVVGRGPRHIDGIGACGDLRIVSAPSRVRGPAEEARTHFFIHTLAAGPDGQLQLLAPERVEIDADEPPRVH